MYCTTCPCLRCASIIANCWSMKRSVQAVVWAKPYRDDFGLRVLGMAGVQTQRYEDIGSEEAFDAWLKEKRDKTF